MKKVFLLILLLVAICARAENGSKVSYVKYGYLMVKTIDNNGQVVQGVSEAYTETEILPAEYKLQANRELRLLVFCNTKAVYVFGFFSNKPVFEYHLNEVQKNDMKITYLPERIEGRECYRLQIKADNEIIIGGVFTLIDGQSYQLKFVQL